MVLTPLPQAGEVHLVPFQELSWYLRAETTDMLVQLVGNLAVFAAFGAGAPVRWRLSLPMVALLAALGAATVELLQFGLDMGRVASVDDVLLNTAGAVLAALATRPWWRTRRPAPTGHRQRTRRYTHIPGRTGSVGQR
jgi:glycopeptide antibiotics resistance protein